MGSERTFIALSLIQKLAYPLIAIDLASVKCGNMVHVLP